MAYLTGILMALVPVVAFVLIRRHRKFPLGPMFLGAGMFLLAQALKISFLPLITATSAMPLLLSLVSALAPGLWEELTKWAPLKWITKARTWDQVLAFGLGFGGFEAIYLGIMAIALTAAVATGQPLPPGPITGMMHITLVDTSVAGLTIGAIFVIERMMAVCLHIYFAVVNGQALRTGRNSYLLYAILIHTVIDFAVAWTQNSFQLNGARLLWVQVPLWILTFAVFYPYIRKAIRQPWPQAN